METGILKRFVEKSREEKLQPVQRFERKFAMQQEKLSFAYFILRQACRPDRQYPINRITSLYFDTAELDQYHRSDSGEFEKKKVRIRWYDGTTDSDGNIPVFLEIKARQGFASSKQRRKFMVPVEKIQPDVVGKGIIDRATLRDTLGSLGYFPENILNPVILISYSRFRFTEMQTGIRVSLDYDISAVAVAPELGHRKRKVQLTGGVIEVKGPSLELPVTLRRMHILDADWSRFSKYGLCIDAFMSDTESISLI